MPALKANVSFVEEPELGNKGMVITLKKDDDIVGHLMIGKASVYWFKKHAKKLANKTVWDDLIKFLKKQQMVKVARP